MTKHAPAPKTAAETQLARAFSALDEPGADRVAAFAAFAKLGLPTRRVEAWHYTDLRAAMREAAPLAAKPDAQRLGAARAALETRPRLGATRFVLVDGHYVEALSDPAPSGVTRSVLAKPAPTGRLDAVLLLNEAFAPQELAVCVEEGVAISGPIEIAHVASGQTPRALYSRMSVALRDNARANFIETFFGAGPSDQRNALARINLNPGARCEWATLVDDAPDLHLESQLVSLGKDADFHGFGLVPGGGLVRRQIFADLDHGAKIALSGLSLLDGRRHADTTLEVTHRAPHGASREFYRHIVADEAIGVYQGKVIVEQYAQKTDGGMKSQAILLSPTAQMNNKPELEIFADDVVCGHGATVGALDPAQLFYLEARGLPRETAEAMLLEAFGVEAIEKLADPVLAEAALSRARAWWNARGARA